MAVTNSDGSIILTTKVDTSGTKQGFREMLRSAKTSATNSKQSFEPLLKIIENQKIKLKSLNEEYAKLIITNGKNTKQTEELRNKIDKLTKEMQENEKVANSLGITSQKSFSKFGTVLSSIASKLALIFSATAIINFSKEASNLAIEQEASVQRLIDIYGNASDKVGDFIDLNAHALGMSKASAVGFSAVYGNLFSVWADQATNAELTNQYLNMTAVVASKTGRTVKDVQERIRSGLLGNTEAIEDLGVFVNVKTIEITDAFQRIADGRSWEQLTAYEQSQVRTLAILEQSTKKYGDQVADTNTLVRARYLAAYQDLQATWGQFVNTVLVPVLKVATKVMDILTAGMRAIAGLTGKTLENTSASASSIGGAVENQEELTDAVKGTNKELKKSTASFDELNIISQDTGSGSGSGGASVGGSGGGFALGELSGSNVINEVDATIAKIVGLVGAGLVAIGIILLCFGHIAWGIGFILAGASIFVASQASLKKGEASKSARNEMNKIIAIVSGALFAIGLILVCFGVITPLSIGLMIAGAVGLVSEVAINRDTIINALKGTLGKIVALISGALLVIGIILCFTGVALPLGIALIAVGAMGLVTVVALNWDAIKQKAISVFTSILNWVKTWGLLVLGVIMVVTGVAFPLGIGLIYAGAKNLTTAQDPKWNALVEKVKATWKAVKDFWNAYIAKYFTSTWWGNLAKNAINGFLKWIVNGLNKLVDKLNTFGFNLPDVLGGGRVGFNISRLSVPQLAKGAVLPPNKPFLSIVGDQKSGTNIEAPLDTIVEAVKIALGGSNGFNGRVEVPIYLDSRQIAVAIRDAENNLGTQTVFGGFANAY